MIGVEIFLIGVSIAFMIGIIFGHWCGEQDQKRFERWRCEQGMKLQGMR